jgi:hypothetical protein
VSSGDSVSNDGDQSNKDDQSSERDVVDDVSKGISCREVRYSESDGVCLQQPATDEALDKCLA